MDCFLIVYLLLYKLSLCKCLYRRIKNLKLLQHTVNIKYELMSMYPNSNANKINKYKLNPNSHNNE